MLRISLAIACFALLINHNVIDAWKLSVGNDTIRLRMAEAKQIRVRLTELDGALLIRQNATLSIVSQSDILRVGGGEMIMDDIQDGVFERDVNLTAEFLGTAKVYATIVTDDDNVQVSNETLDVVIVREERPIDRIFTYSVIVLVSILYINFGAALDVAKVKEILVRPIGPLLAFACKFLCMPLLSYVLGLVLFPNNLEMQLGMFFTGVSPSGGASNVWSVILGGNLDLSISMTTINTLSAFAMMPLWLFTLGATIFNEGELVIPYARIGYVVIGLIVPLCIGLMIQRYLPSVARILVRILKTCSSLLIIFIIVFAIVTNLYLFQLFTWQIFIAGLGLPWIAYGIGFVIATLFRQKHEDSLAIAIEAGVQNTGIAILLCRIALGQPQGDLTTVIPVSVAIATPFPLLMYYVYLKGKDRFSKHRRGAVPVPTHPPAIPMTTVRKNSSNI